MTVFEVVTSLGVGRWHLDAPPSRRDAPPSRQRLTVALGHGAGGGVEAPDLLLLASTLPAFGVAVARFEQPWRVTGRPVAGPPAQLDRAWIEGMEAVALDGPLVVGGRSAGARVACRTAAHLGAIGVLALAFPLHPPGRPTTSRAGELPDLPMIAIQGSRDPFGSAAELGEALDPVQHVGVEVSGADHALRVGRTAPVTQAEADETIVLAVRRWLRQVGEWTG